MKRAERAARALGPLFDGCVGSLQERGAHAAEDRGIHRDIPAEG